VAKKTIAKKKKANKARPETAETASTSRIAAAKAKLVKARQEKKTTKKAAAKQANKGSTAKPKSPLTKKETEEFRRMLLEKRQTLLGDMNGMEAEALRSNRHDATGDLSTMPMHMADIGTDNYEQEFTLGLLESERQILREIDESLDRIASGTYGICVGTGEPISQNRLRAKPWAKYTIEYARKIEKGLVRKPRSNFGLYDEQDNEQNDEVLAD